MLAFFNALAAVLLVAVAVLGLYLSNRPMRATDSAMEMTYEEGAGIIGGAEGPTAVWMTCRTPGFFHLLVVVLLTANAVTLWRLPGPR
jgi:Na+-transporting methylmalonyl-CoA/oxaloacetate decarboxylase beta subunit